MGFAIFAVNNILSHETLDSCKEKLSIKKRKKKKPLVAGGRKWKKTQQESQRRDPSPRTNMTCNRCERSEQQNHIHHVKFLDTNSGISKLYMKCMWRVDLGRQLSRSGHCQVVPEPHSASPHGDLEEDMLQKIIHKNKATQIQILTLDYRYKEIVKHSRAIIHGDPRVLTIQMSYMWKRENLLQLKNERLLAVSKVTVSFIIHFSHCLQFYLRISVEVFTWFSFTYIYTWNVIFNTKKRHVPKKQDHATLPAQRKSKWQCKCLVTTLCRLLTLITFIDFVGIF